ncbi:YgiW/YdeI family stress tolerance OB fold protein [Aeromonas sp. R6-2]|uniref:YgiW/YdeI family stress tolerance OB fold protein n=1 Tax=unclassified Aeromonas TaxID=257493 RepID=UPI0034A44A6B
MNKMMPAALILMLSLSGAAQAAFTGEQHQNAVSAAQVKKAADDSWVTLEGKLVKHLGGENYLLRDASGEVEVEIDGDVWCGQEVGPNDTIRLYGEVDHSWNRVEVEAQRLEKVGAAPVSKGGFVSQ